MSETNAVAYAEPVEKAKKHSQAAAVFRRLRRNKLAVLGLVLIVLLILMAIFAPLLAPYGYADMNLKIKHASPSWAHPFGADELGRDILSRIIYGSRYSLSLGIFAMLVSNVIGIALGSLAGYWSGRTDNVILRFMDILQSIPGILLAIVISTVLGPGFVNTILALSVGNIPMTVRLLRASIMGIRKEQYLEAATAINCSPVRTMAFHVFPNSYAPLLVSATMGIGNMIMQAAALSYIGLGVQPPLAEWGAMLSAARSFIRDYPHEIIFPGLFIMLTVLAFNLFGDGLRDALDPKLKN